MSTDAAAAIVMAALEPATMPPGWAMESEETLDAYVFGVEATGRKVAEHLGLDFQQFIGRAE